MNKDIELTVKQVLATQLGLEASELTTDAKLRDDLGCDSLDEVEIVMALEDELQLEIPDEEAEKLLNGAGADVTVGALVEFARNKAQQR
jgi:acyl carrier protein